MPKTFRPIDSTRNPERETKMPRKKIVVPSAAIQHDSEIVFFSFDLLDDFTLLVLFFMDQNRNYTHTHTQTNFKSNLFLTLSPLPSANTIVIVVALAAATTAAAPVALPLTINLLVAIINYQIIINKMNLNHKFAMS